jgi:3-hydroxyacyl-CoA dehydrogenase/3a,7a,12a-trihydroxy-5b-cholest-24-enoyl-CoA hydratase
MRLQYRDRVVIVTGAGQGLGRSHALEFARRGAKVVVNDLGGGASGDGCSASVAQAVVDEIHGFGGEAVASSDSVEHGEKIVETAMDNFGRVDVIINNAGILRDASFAKMTDNDWQLVLDIHLTGSYRVTKAAWPYMRTASYGRIVMTTSTAGVYGNFGQANYAAAKLGIVGLANTLAIEGASKNIRVNTIAPTAASRLTSTVLPPDVLAILSPQYVTPLVILLAHESGTETGHLFEVGGGWVSQTRWEQTQGVFFQNPFSTEELSEKWPEATSFVDARHGSSIADVKTGVREHLGRDMVLVPQKKS